MKVRIQSLSGIDPLRVPLPHGTEVTTRVDRAHQGRVITQGALGRVVSVEAGGVLVRIVGVGSVRYAREELTPRKAGQLEFAIRREAAWRDLKANTVIETIVGSRAWGLANEDSDTDRRGVFVLPFSWRGALVQVPEDLTSADGSDTYWEVEKTFRQAIRADPNTLETIMLPGAKAIDPMGEWILGERQAFISTEIYGSFGRYALSQLKRLRQNLRLAEHRSLLIEWLAKDPNMSLDEASKLLVDAVALPGKPQDQVLRAKEYIKQLYSSLYDQGLLEERNFTGLTAFASEKRSYDFDLSRELRPKNAYNLLRLLATATGWLRTGTPEFEVQGALRNELLAIKAQEVELGTVLERSEELAAKLEEARKDSVLPAHPNVTAIDALLRRVRQESARRWHAELPGAFGQDASELPLAEWNEGG